MQEFLQRYRDGIIGGGIGLILAILLLMIGFLKTLLVIVCTFVGAFIGIYLNRTGFLSVSKILEDRKIGRLLRWKNKITK
ncbi:DUF2273 domain-containing protein [Tetragenococcus halophilus]|uniref:DUF2273 domain-containing protein n=1 Tax=Tetragenococcus halophilus TaxID=51669 RepID=UPI001B5AE0C7|nr:DUF2273 domain-containing protein [Tetragenococcus halophilus]GFK27775.1 hypothetical protein YG2_02090 [Tetragenococcus halophilus]GLL50246.1 hypothetical protein YA5_002170 [Tetragenococcus halophilus]